MNKPPTTLIGYAIIVALVIIIMLVVVKPYVVDQINSIDVFNINYGDFYEE